MTGAFSIFPGSLPLLIIFPPLPARVVCTGIGATCNVLIPWLLVILAVDFGAFYTLEIHLRKRSNNV